jgi:hypothetical protein
MKIYDEQLNRFDEQKNGREEQIKDEWTNEGMNEQKKGWISKRRNGRAKEGMDEKL